MRMLAIITTLFLVGCDQSPTGPTNEVYGLKYDKLFDEPTLPPGRPSLPCGWSADTAHNQWIYDIHADTCNTGGGNE
jgi:hypothetical protein